MKKLLTLGLILGMTWNQMNGAESLQSAIQTLDESVTLEDLECAFSMFEDIIPYDQDNWLVYYYAAYSLTKMELIVDKVHIDKYADRALEYLDRAEARSKQNSEIFCLRALIHSGKIRVDKDARGFKFVTVSNALLKKAKQLDPDNPRVYYVMGMNTLGIPSLLGGGESSAIKHFNTAADLFKKEAKSNKGFNLPHWGKSKCHSIINKIEKNES